MFILYEISSGKIKMAGTEPIPGPAKEGYAITELQANSIDLQSYLYDPTQGLILRPDYENVIQQKKIMDIRARRNSKLASCDWTQLPDNNLTDQAKQAWADYRQNLRDFMSTLPSPVPNDYRPIWPTKPNN